MNIVSTSLSSNASLTAPYRFVPPFAPILSMYDLASSRFFWFAAARLPSIHLSTPLEKSTMLKNALGSSPPTQRINSLFATSIRD